MLGAGTRALSCEISKWNFRRIKTRLATEQVRFMFFNPLDIRWPLAGKDRGDESDFKIFKGVFGWTENNFLRRCFSNHKQLVASFLLLGEQGCCRNTQRVTLVRDAA